MATCRWADPGYFCLDTNSGNWYWTLSKPEPPEEEPPEEEPPEEEPPEGEPGLKEKLRGQQEWLDAQYAKYLGDIKRAGGIREAGLLEALGPYQTKLSGMETETAERYGAYADKLGTLSNDVEAGRITQQEALDELKTLSGERYGAYSGLLNQLMQGKGMGAGLQDKLQLSFGGAPITSFTPRPNREMMSLLGNIAGNQYTAGMTDITAQQGMTNQQFAAAMTDIAAQQSMAGQTYQAGLQDINLRGQLAENLFGKALMLPELQAGNIEKLGGMTWAGQEARPLYGADLRYLDALMALSNADLNRRFGLGTQTQTGSLTGPGTSWLTDLGSWINLIGGQGGLMDLYGQGQNFGWWGQPGQSNYIGTQPGYEEWTM